MEFQRLARSALAGLSQTSTTTTSTTTMTSLTKTMAPLARPPLSSSFSSSPFRFQSARFLSTTALRYGPPPQSWPPARAPAGTNGAAAASPNSSQAAEPKVSPTASLNKRYASDKPAQWATWSSNDFNQRNSQHGRGAGQGQGAAANGSSFDKYNEMNSLEFNQKSRELPFPLKPEAGKTTYVSNRTDVASAFRLCNVTLSLNRTRNYWNKQRFHERPGLRRKRLATQTWRRKFRTCMVTTVKRVKDLARQGW
ncbi:ribosomal protein s21 [Ophiostoma piceae UAMH 11346]|uniref:Ribosomal protein s21 n=1 Tax=Ophiostoma piceae (strain UAMH 11346) TaxID=1262450 RepID=S3CZT3_OPHP1|nr:ribosomal protein s21 [Ophiostoma piceae UAMH 11346]